MTSLRETALSSSKQLAKTTIERYPLLKNNRLFYEVSRARALRGMQVRPEAAQRPDLLRELDEKGIVVVPDYIPRADAEAMLNAAEPVLAAARAGELPEYTFTNQPEIVLRVAETARLVPETRRFFEDPVIRSVMEAYLSPDIASYRHELDYRYGYADEGIRQTDLFHFDNWRPICKAFLYLTDVTEDNAPFVYIPGTHKPATWRRRHEIAYDVYGPDGPFGHLLPQELRALKRDHGWEEQVCCGAPGTLILADFRGLHAGTPLKSGRRVLLTNAFDAMNSELSAN